MDKKITQKEEEIGRLEDESKTSFDLGKSVAKISLIWVFLFVIVFVVSLINNLNDAQVGLRLQTCLIVFFIINFGAAVFFLDSVLIKNKSLKLQLNK